jgi:hypothetical protein
VTVRAAAVVVGGSVVVVGASAVVVVGASVVVVVGTGAVVAVARLAVVVGATVVGAPAVVDSQPARAMKRAPTMRALRNELTM